MATENINTWQAIQQKWEGSVVAPEERTPESRTERMLEEVDELKQAVIELDGSPLKNYEAAMEATDVIIVALGVIDSLGYDIERLIHEKMGVNFKKYNPVTNLELRGNGHSHAEARAIQKQNWKKP